MPRRTFRATSENVSPHRTITAASALACLSVTALAETTPTTTDKDTLKNAPKFTYSRKKT